MTTISDFLRLLEQVRFEFDWILTPDTGRDSDRRSSPRYHLQATPKNHPLILDPIRAAAYACTGNVAESWVDAAIGLQIRSSDAQAIAAAAGDRTWAGPEGNRWPEEQLIDLRQSLLGAVGMLASGSRTPDSALLVQADFSPPVSRTD